MTAVDGPAGLAAAEAARRIAAGALTSEALVRACLDRIAEREPVVRAWAHLDPDDAVARARALDSSPLLGPLHGVPFGVKDIFDTADLPTECGSPLYRGRRPARDAAAAAALREAGALVLGKTVTTEFAYRTPGPTRNPHDPAHTPGGSSSGSAAAVADRMVPFALGSQTGGSTIRPAAYCGVAAFKPTYGFVSTDGMHPLAMALDTVGWFARDPGDLELVGSVLGALQPAQGATPDAPAPPPRLGVVRTPEWDRVSPAGRRAVEGAAAAAADAGWRVRDAELPGECDGLGGAWETIVAAGAASAFAAGRRDGLGAPLRALIEAGLGLSGPSRAGAEALALHCRAAVSEAFAHADAFLTPAAPGEAPAGLGSTGEPVCNRVWTLLRLPCAALPAGRGEGGLPVAVQLVGRHGGDRALLGVARRLAALLPAAPAP